MHTHSSAPSQGVAPVRTPGRRRTGAASVATLLALGLMPVLPWASPAQAAVTVGEAFSVFPDRDMVVVSGYELGEQLLVEVLRDGVVIGTTQGPAVETPDGIGIEINHGPLGTAQPGDCWTNFTPDIIGGDVIRVTTVDRPASVPRVDTMTVKDVAFTGAPVANADGSVSVSGTATPGTSFAVEFRRDKPDPRFRRGPFNPVFEPGTNRWTATFRPTATSAEGLTAAQQRQIALDEASWLAVAVAGNETTLAELGEPGGVGPGCTGSADPNTLVGGLEPINLASGDVTFSGTARNAVAAVSVTVGGLGAREATVTPGAPGTPSTWTLAVPKTDLLTLPDGNVAVTPRYDGLAGTARTVLKDTVAPEAPTPSVAPGTYTTTQSVALNKPAGETTSKVYWEIGNSAVPDPDEFSNLYTSQISVTSTQTLKGRLVDAAGNAGAVGTFAYRIGTPPAAPTGLAAAETAPAGSARLTWNAASGASGYNVYRSDIKVNATPLTGTSYTDTAAGLGTHSYVVRAVESNGIESLNSNVVPLTIAAPAVPTGLRATQGDTRVTLNWTAVTGAANYRVYRDGAVVAQAVAGTSYIDTGRTNGTLYEYSIASLDASGNESARTGVVQAVPQVPTDTTPPPAPTVNPATGTYTTAQTVQASNTEAGATQRYTVATGTTAPADPTVTSPVLPSGGLPVSATSSVKVASFDAAGNRSTVVSRTITIGTSTPPAGTRTVIVNASADTMVRQAAATTAGGSLTTLTTDSQGSNGNLSTRETSYLRFAVPALNSGESVTAANLSLNVTNATSNGPAVWRTATTWTESSMTYGSGQPARSGTAAVGNFGSVAVGRATTPVSGSFASGSTVSFQLFADASDGLDFTSRETTARPQLVLTVSTGGTTTPPPSTTTIRVPASADTMIKQATPDTAQASTNPLWADREETTGNAATSIRTFLKFNVTGIPTGATVTGARLQVRTAVTNGGADNGPTIFRTSNNWTESLTWNAIRPTRETTAVGNFAPGTTPNANTVYSTGISRITGNGEVSLELAPDTSDGLGIFSRESANAADRPTLLITYQTP